MKHFLYLVLSFFIVGCSKNIPEKNYQYYCTLFNNKTAFELTNNSGDSRVLVSPFYQGRILTSSYNNIEGLSNGWINENALTDTTKSIGGEERLWIGPLGSQFSFYFQQIQPLHDDNWKVPATIDAEPYKVIYKSNSNVELYKTMQLTNYIGTTFNIEINRNISILSKENIQKNLNIEVDNSTKFVAFETKHKLKNIDTVTWKKHTGLAGLWSAGMYPGDDSVVIIPLKNNGTKHNVLTYLAPIDSTRFIVKNNTVLFKTDGQYRSKIGIPPQFAPAVYGCYSKLNNKLTIIQYKKETDSLYSNSQVSIQDTPYKGEAIPIYNNGSDFFELESNAPLKVLKPNETTTHWQRVYHFNASKNTLNKLSKKLLGFDLNSAKF